MGILATTSNFMMSPAPAHQAAGIGRYFTEQLLLLGKNEFIFYLKAVFPHLSGWEGFGQETKGRKSPVYKSGAMSI